MVLPTDGKGLVRKSGAMRDQEGNETSLQARCMQSTLGMLQEVHEVTPCWMPFNSDNGFVCPCDKLLQA